LTITPTTETGSCRGAGLQYVKYNNATQARIRPEIRDSVGNLIQPAVTTSFTTAIDFFKYGLFGQISRTFLGEKLGVSLGIRADGNSFTDEGNALQQTLSPRLSVSYALAPDWKVSASAGRYFKIAPYTALGFRDENNTLVNRNLPYLRSDHLVAGMEYLPTKTLRLTLEGFYKKYANYPVSNRTGISLANQGADFGIIGNERLTGNGTGEVLRFRIFRPAETQQKFLFRGLLYAVLDPFCRSGRPPDSILLG
jgi:outer membrane receptor protein involved in Fe transport